MGLLYGDTAGPDATMIEHVQSPGDDLGRNFRVTIAAESFTSGTGTHRFESPLLSLSTYQQVHSEI